MQVQEPDGRGSPPHCVNSGHAVLAQLIGAEGVVSVGPPACAQGPRKARTTCSMPRCRATGTPTRHADAWWGALTAYDRAGQRRRRASGPGGMPTLTTKHLRSSSRCDDARMRLPHHVDVDRVLVLHGEPVALVEPTGSAALQNVQADRHTVSVGPLQQRPQDG